MPPAMSDKSRHKSGASQPPRAQITTNRDSIASRATAAAPRAVPPNPRSCHNADVPLDRRYPMRVRRVLCLLFYNPLPYCPSTTDKGNIWEANVIFV